MLRVTDVINMWNNKTLSSCDVIKFYGHTKETATVLVKRCWSEAGSRKEVEKNVYKENGVRLAFRLLSQVSVSLQSLTFEEGLL